MPTREIVGKSVAFGLIAAACIGGGLLVLYGPHAYNDYLNIPLAIVLFGLGLGVAGVGALIVAGIVIDARIREREARIHIAPRPGPLAVPPAWGMADVGRPGAREVGDGAAERGGGGARVMSVALSNLDAPLVIIFLLIWTVGFCIWLAPR